MAAHSLITNGASFHLHYDLMLLRVTLIIGIVVVLRLLGCHPLATYVAHLAGNLVVILLDVLLSDP